MSMSQWSRPTIGSRPVVVLGAGVLGRRIACVWAAGGYNVIIRDPGEEHRHAAMLYIDSNVQEYAKKAEHLSHTKIGSYSATDDLKVAVKDAWLVVEAVPENLNLKIDVFGDLAKFTPGDCCLCSNSSSYKSSAMLDKVDASQRFRVLNAHYYMPPDNRLVELMTDGETDPAILDFLYEQHAKVGMKPIRCEKESTGFVFNRIWAAVKREVLQVLAEGVATPEQIDSAWLETFVKSPAGPCAMMDAVGLDTVANIEEHYVTERHISSQSLDFVRKNYVEKGLLGAKSGNGGLYPAGKTTKGKNEDASHHDNLHAPMLYFLDLVGSPFIDGIALTRKGRVVCGAFDGRPLRTIVGDQRLPDGIDISLANGRLYWTCMGIPSSNDGCINSCNLDGSDLQTVVRIGQTHTPKQLIVEPVSKKLYWCDREGMRVMRCNLDGSAIETLVQTGDFSNPAHMADQTRWCVGVAVDTRRGLVYWTQKGPSKGSRGRILRAGLEVPAGATAAQRADVETLLDKLPECIDLELDQERQVLYWTDRGEIPIGNSINRTYVGPEEKREELIGKVELSDLEQKLGYQILATHLHEAIGIKLDQVNRHVYATDLGGAVYRWHLDTKERKKVYEDEGSFTGLTLVHV